MRVAVVAKIIGIHETVLKSLAKKLKEFEI